MPQPAPGLPGSSSPGSTVLGYPRIGPRRELKRAVESYWSGTTGAAELLDTAGRLRVATWTELAASGLESVPGNTFSLYDHVLDTSVLFGAVPPRFAALGLSGLDTYFAMARGHGEAEPLELTKWFDTNYHHLVPEIDPDTRFTLAGDKPVAEFTEAAAAGVLTRPVVLGPVSFLLLSKPGPAAPDFFVPLDLLDPLLDCYADLLDQLATAGAGWVQLDEPAFVTDRGERELVALDRAYQWLGTVVARPRLLVTGSYGDLGHALGVLAATPVEAIGVDLVSAPHTVARVASLPNLRDRSLVAGVVDGRNVWRTDLSTALSTCTSLRGLVGELAVSTSCSLLHVPHDLTAEDGIDPAVAHRLAFARQKVAEVVTLARALRPGTGRVVTDPAVPTTPPAPAERDDRIRARLGALTADQLRRADPAERVVAQQHRLGLPPLPTTTIGSFPQTGPVRAARADLRAGRLDQAGYDALMRAEVERVIRMQERIGLDVLVHGEPERSDMVQYFAEHLAGFATTEHGWVQSYGSRCVRPPILYGDVSRAAPITVRWTSFAQSLTDRPVKGMLTGPVTMLAWSFVRTDQPLADTARQVALALRDEIADLEAAGIGIIQVDEPALREMLPLRNADRPAYLSWAVEAFRLATAGAAPTTQIHTHLCYSEFGEVIEAIDGLDADVTTIEAARSRMEVLDDLAQVGFTRGVGPGVYDIHSPQVPTAEHLAGLLRDALATVPAERLWVNPDCGLKTRRYAEVDPALHAMVAAAARVRAELT